MSRKQKISILCSIVNECFCDIETFSQNVLDTDGKEVFTKKLDKCSSREDLESLVNEYI